MKTKLIALLMLLTMAGPALSMGHPHNLFAARKQMKAKMVAMTPKSGASVGSCKQLFVTIDKAEFARRLLTALAAVRSGK